MRRAVAGQLCQQRVLAGAGGFDAGGLHVAVAADLLGQVSQLQHGVVRESTELAERGVDGVLVLDDQRALLPALARVAERVEACAAQPLEARQYGKQALRAGPVRALARRAAFQRRENGRRQMKAQRDVAFKSIGQRAAEVFTAEQARHLVLILVSHQLEQVVRHGGGQRLLAGGGALGLPHVLDKVHVAARIGFVLVGRQEAAAMREHSIQAGRLLQLDDGFRQWLARPDARVERRIPPPLERTLIGRHGHAVNFNGAQDGRLRQRQQPTLKRIAQHQQVGVQRIAQVVLRERTRVNKLQPGLGRFPQQAAQLLGGELPVRSAYGRA